MMQIELDPWEYEHALHVGARRFIENWGKADAAHYDKKRMEDNRTALAAASVGELAVAKITKTSTKVSTISTTSPAPALMPPPRA